MMTFLLMLLTAILPPQPAPMPSGLGATIRWQYECEAAAETLALLEGPSWHNWIATDCDQPHHTPTAYGMALPDDVGGRFWLVGSEPNVPATRIAPADAAALGREWADSGAAWACCGTLQHHRQNGHGWLDAYLDAGGPVGDAWSIHIYFTPLTHEWDATIDQFRAWMQANDVERPIIVSETAQTSNLPPDILLRHVAQADVQAVFWYSGDEDAYHFAPQSELTRDGKRTPLGDVFVQLTQAAGQGDEPEMLRMWLPMVR